MINLHIWDTNHHFNQYNFDSENDLVEFLINTHCRFTNSELGSIAQYHYHESIMEYIRDTLARDGFKVTLDKFESRCDTDFLTIKNIKELLKEKSLRVYIENEFTHMYMSINK